MAVPSIALFSETDRRRLLGLAAEAGFVAAGLLDAPRLTAVGPAALGRRPPGDAPPGLLVVALAYGNRPAAESGHPWALNAAGAAAGGAAAEIAPFARRDYYGEAVARLKRLAVAGREIWGGRRSDYRIFCNSGLREKPLALAAGIGERGRNGLVITADSGSLVVLAALTLPFAPFGGVAPGAAGGALAAGGAPAGGAAGAAAGGAGFGICGACRACVAACPTGALDGEGGLDAGRCLQAWASRPGEVPPEVAARWGRLLYGCQICQAACPHNRRDIAGAATERGALPAALAAAAIAAAGDGELRAAFRGTALGLAWLEPAILRRNAALAASAAASAAAAAASAVPEAPV